MLDIEVGYILETQFGLSDVQGTTTVSLDEGESYEFEPAYIPPEVGGWYPVFTAAISGELRMLPKKKRGELATISTNDPVQMREKTQPVKPTYTVKAVKYPPVEVGG